MSQNNSFWFWLGVVADICQLESYELLLQDANNNDLMEELHHQDSDFLTKIIKQNEEIIALLKERR